MGAGTKPCKRCGVARPCGRGWFCLGCKDIAEQERAEKSRIRAKRRAIRATQQDANRAGKQCPQCKSYKTRDDFGVNARSGRLLTKCRECAELAAKAKAKVRAKAIYAAMGKDQFLQKLRRYQKPDRAMIRGRQRRQVLSDGYVRELLAQYSPVAAGDFPQALVDAKRVHLQLKRLLKGICDA